MNIIERVRYSRNCTNDSFPLPTVTDCLWYAHSESGETASSLMYVRRPGDKRNNNRDRDPRREWGQCGYMLASAWIQLRKDDDFEIVRVSNVRDFDAAFADAASAITYSVNSIRFPGELAERDLYDALQLWAHACKVAGWDIDQLIDEVCADFERKHCVVREVQ